MKPIPSETKILRNGRLVKKIKAPNSFLLNGQSLSVEMHIFTGRYAQKNVHLSGRKLVSNLFKACPIFSTDTPKPLG